MPSDCRPLQTSEMPGTSTILHLSRKLTWGNEDHLSKESTPDSGLIPDPEPYLDWVRERPQTTWAGISGLVSVHQSTWHWSPALDGLS